MSALPWRCWRQSQVKVWQTIVSGYSTWTTLKRLISSGGKRPNWISCTVRNGALEYWKFRFAMMVVVEVAVVADGEVAGRGTDFQRQSEREVRTLAVMRHANSSDARPKTVLLVSNVPPERSFAIRWLRQPAYQALGRPCHPGRLGPVVSLVIGMATVRRLAGFESRHTGRKKRYRDSRCDILVGLGGWRWSRGLMKGGRRVCLQLRSGVLF